ncbi:MAG: hypothetical protein MMC33_005488 [Icmadophila ericetorum]|nr:hypothetical protein [Icmadophila ericetorum]
MLLQIILYGIGWSIYNVYFHPLAKFPGPILYAASYLPFYWTLGRGDLVSKSRELHERYGSVIRVNPNMLYFTDAQAWKQIHGHRQGKRLMIRDSGFYFNKNNGAADIVRSNDADHTRIRKLLSHGFSEQALRDQEPLIMTYVNLLIQKLCEQSQKSKAIDIVRWLNFTSFDIIGDLCFGEPFGGLQNQEYHSIVSNIFKSFKHAQYLVIANAYPPAPALMAAIMKLFGIENHTKRQAHRDFCTKAIDKRTSIQTDRKDFMAQILRYNDEKGMTQQEIIGTVAGLISGGSETIATLLSGAIFYLLKSPYSLNKINKEIRSTFKSEEDIVFSSVLSLPYLQAVLDESLRIYPPVPGALHRRTPPEGDIIDGYKVPGNVVVGIPQWTTNHSAQNFRDPDAFIPERWLGDARFANDNRAAVQPFSIGARNCVGKNLAYAEMRIILCRLLWRFDMTLCHESSDWASQKTWYLWSKEELKVSLRDRLAV